MKKLLYTIVCGLSLALLSSCDAIVEKLNPDTSGSNATVSAMKGVFYTATNDTETLNLLPGKSRNVEAHVGVKDGKVSDMTLKLTLKVDAEGVAAYNRTHGSAPAEMLPSAAYQFVNNDLMLARFNTTSTAAKIRITATDLEDGKLYVLPVIIDKVEGTDNWELAEDAFAFITVSQANQGPEGGDGSMEYPYELSTVADLKAMKDKLSQDEKVYFKLMNDIDMADVNDWTPLNAASPYLFAIDFDGDGHTISNFHVTDVPTYPSFFGVLNGYCHDVTFMNANIECGGDSGCGILGGYGGTGAIHADVARVHVHGKVTLTGNKTGVGGMFGCAGNVTIEASSADVDVWSGKNYVGGLIGYSKKALISNCWTAGSVRGDQRVGGIAGGINGDGDAIINCYSIAKLWSYKKDESGAFTDEKEYGCLRSVGGIVAHANQDKGNEMDTRMPGNIVSGCIAWEEEIKTRTYLTGEVDITKDNYYSSGAIVAFGASHNTYENCYRRADLDFRDYCDLFLLYDQENSSPTSPLIYNKIEGAGYNYPYHGKAAPVGATLTQVAQSLGWSSAIWNFSGDIPTIKPDAQVGPVPDVTGEGQLPGFGENDIN